MKKLFIFFTIVWMGTVVSSCKENTTKTTETNNDGLLMATLFVQQSSEYKALCYQVYNFAQTRLDQKIALYKGEKALAVIVDIDETVLDNSPFSARSIIKNTDYPKYWDEWCNKAEAKPIPGSLEFLKYAESQGVETFYISNRKIHLTPATLKNLQNYGFPFADSTHLFLRNKSSDKELRRNFVRQTHDILLFFGDNLGDFSNEFDDKGTALRQALTVKYQNDFGEEYMVLPNPTYGTWMNALRENIAKTADMDSVYKSKLIDF